MIILMTLSVLLQFAAAYLSIRMVRITGKYRAWSLITAAITLAALRRTAELTRLIFASTGNPPNATGELFSFLTSICMVAGVAYIAPLFLSIKRSEAELKEAKDKTREAYTELDKIFNNSSDGMRVLDMHCNPLKLNKTFLKMLDMTEEEALSRKCYEMFPCQQRNTAKCSISRVMKGEERFEEEITVGRNDGENIFCILTVTPFYSPDASVTGVIEYFKDITVRKKLETQLMQSQKMEAVGRLAGGIAHDFNNLLTPIIGYSDLVLTELPENNLVRDKIRVIKDTGTRAAELVARLLAFSRKQVLEMKPVSLNEIVWNMHKIFARTIGEDIELELIINRSVRNISADEGQIEQILMNLVVNAADAMPNGGRLIIKTADVYLDETYELMHSQSVKPGQYVMLSVTDTGIGMSHEIMEMIFEPFFTTKEAGKGTGLGLSTTYGIIKQHNGYMWVYSEPGKGTAFKVYLPAILERTKKINRVEQLETAKGTETILVVDDESIVRQFIIDVLQPVGYKVLEASCGDEALQICGNFQGKIDLLLTDLVLPGMKGQEFATLFTEKRPEAKVIFMSGYLEGFNSDNSISIPGELFIQKPLTPGKLTMKLREVLDMSPERSAMFFNNR